MRVPKVSTVSAAKSLRSTVTFKSRRQEYKIVMDLSSCDMASAARLAMLESAVICIINCPEVIRQASILNNKRLEKYDHRAVPRPTSGISYRS